MFKFIHAADLHLDAPLRGLSQVETAPVEAIRGASRRAFETLVSLAIEEQVAFVLLAGDIFDTGLQDFGSAIFLAKQMGRLGRAGIHVVAVTGNHDSSGGIIKNLELPENMRMLSARQPQTVVLEDVGDGVAIHGQSYDKKHQSKNLARSFPRALAGQYNIGLLHTSLDGREHHAEYAPCTVEDLEARGYQYWALGHVHTRDVVKESPLIVFPGCIQGRHARETGPKGCALVTVDELGAGSLQWLELDVLRWEHIQVDLGEAASKDEAMTILRGAMSDARQGAQGRPLALRVEIVAGNRAIEPMLSDHSLTDIVRVLAAEIAYEEIWLERVLLSWRPPSLLPGGPGLLPGGGLRPESGLDDLTSQIRSTPERLDAVDGLEQEVQTLLKGIPDEASQLLKDALASADRGDDWIGPVVARAKALLLSRLLAERDLP